MNAFWRLSACRGHGHAGPQPIAMIDIVAYADFVGLSVTREEFVEIILRLDRQWRTNQG